MLLILKSEKSDSKLCYGFFTSETMAYNSHPIVDNGIALRLLYILCTPFTEFPAYRAGIIDDKGKYIIPKSKRTPTQNKSLTYLDRLMINIKKIINKLPFGENKLKNIVTAMFLIKECIESNREPEEFLTEEKIRSTVVPTEERNNIIRLWDDYCHGKVEEDVIGNTTAGVAGYSKPIMSGVMRRRREEDLRRMIDLWRNGNDTFKN